MREIQAPLQSHLSEPVTTLCTAWKLELSDGRVFGFTEHDENLEVDGVLYSARSSQTQSETESRLGFSADNGSIQGVLESLVISSADIDDGVLRGAKLSHLKINWTAPSQYVVLSVGEVGQVTTQGEYFEVEWLGFSAKLNRSTGRVFSKKCDAKFGDERCGLLASNYGSDVICPKTFTACRDQFHNAENFRGFPYLLGADALLAAPQLGELKDGGSRYR
ncbi:putative phage protein (TIGR02218 family) [Litorimonas taeanensis]|uniref:Putative phage protein (TIGR02218 family) n=1 Tax=Litorimonas taeanensis TaxID=568099 RepID=A0A420WIT3_9PROT|nr:DUF2163 domain-containing protein [Litorimonas taeanensis]RKQ70913.1 putative phage protein (TIGR02218 family) [Litorimonas taeanensis]